MPPISELVRRVASWSVALPGAFLFLACATALAGTGLVRWVPRGPIFNQDDTEFYFDRSAAEMSGAAVDAYVDAMSQCGVGTFVSCVNAQRANYASRVWETDWTGYDPSGPDTQPIFRHLPAASIAITRRRLDSAMRLAQLGVNFHARALARCRHDGIGAWVSVRMNDLHDCRLEDAPLLSSFYKDQRTRGLLRNPGVDLSWADHGLDWERPEVRDHYMALVREQLDTLDLDGLELDWMRFGYHFRPGHELEGGRVITAWMWKVRAECAAAARRLGHPVRLGVRVPERPDTARRCGLDAVAWARAGLVDLVVPTPFWSTCDFDMPIVEWRRLLEGTSAALAGGLEVRYQPVPNGPATTITAELATGAALAVLHGGADAVYLFNYMPGRTDPAAPWTAGLANDWGLARYRRVVAAMASESALAGLPRTHAVTYRDFRAPGEPSDAALPAGWHGEDMPWPSGCAFRVATGPKPEAPSELRLGLAPRTVRPARLEVHVNGVRVAGRWNAETRVLSFALPAGILEDEAQVVQVYAPGGDDFAVDSVEIAVPGVREKDKK
jgi:hypothetical protein